MKCFISYKIESEEDSFVQRVYFHLKEQDDIQPYFSHYHDSEGDLSDQLRSEINSSAVLIFFWGRKIGDIQNREARYASKKDKKIIPIRLPDKYEIDALHALDFVTNLNSVEVANIYAEGAAQKCAMNIISKLEKIWIPVDGLPIDYPFDYEKDIIKEFVEGNGTLSPKRIQKGCPVKWPKLKHFGSQTVECPVSQEEIGTYRDLDKNNKTKNPQVLPVALSEYHDSHCLIKSGITFSEAGPRKNLSYPKSKNKSLKVAILVSGGIAPGINAVISGIVTRQALYAVRGKYRLDVLGYPEGFKSLFFKRSEEHNYPDYKILYSFDPRNSKDYLPPDLPDLPEYLNNCADQGGSILSTSRMSILSDLQKPETRSNALKEIVSSLSHDGVDILYVIGGDGSMKAAHSIWKYAEKKSAFRKLSVIAIPKTMDNDILWVWQSFGFLSAVEWAKGAIRQLYEEVIANPRVGVIQLFGSDSGFVVSHAALASGVCDLALIPEIKFSMSEVVKYVKRRLRSRFRFGQDGKSPHCIILMAENAIPIDAKEYLKIEEIDLTENEQNAVENFEDNNRRVYGKTPDYLRNAGLKIVSRVLQMEIRKMRNPYWENFEVFTNEPRHLIRSIPPSSSDVIYGERLGTLAADCGMAGYTDFMISQWLTEYVMVPLQLVVLGRKRVPTDGIFWKSVIAKTNQPADLEKNQ
jgi:6-phosphofructokinase 1